MHNLVRGRQVGKDNTICHCEKLYGSCIMRMRKDTSLGQGVQGMDSQKRALSVRGHARLQGRAKVGWQMEQHVQRNRDTRRPHKTGNWVPSGGSGLKCVEKENM